MRKCWRTMQTCLTVVATLSLTVLFLPGCPEGGVGPISSSDPSAAGFVMVPTNPAPYVLAVDGSPLTMNADLSTGSWEWYKFSAEAGRKYYILASGNAPINVMLFQGVKEDEDAKEMAVMLWTTDPTEPQFFYWERPGFQAPPEVVGVKSAENKAIAIPSFIAPATGPYYVVVQAAKVLECLPNCKNEDVRLAAYYDVRTYSVQVSTGSESADANALTVYNPATDESPFMRGQVKINKHDWFYFEAEAGANYTIEFMEPSVSRGNVSAVVYSPLGDITCEVIDCDNCRPQPLYAPYAGRYFILVTLDGAPTTSGYHDLTPDMEFFGCEYLLRVFKDDHGNLPALATRIETPGLNATEGQSGFLTRGDEDWFDFVPEPFSTYWVETRGNNDLRLNVSGAIELDVALLPDINTEIQEEMFPGLGDFMSENFQVVLPDDEAIGLAAFIKRDWDGRNDMAVYRTDARTDPFPFSVKMPHKPLNPFQLEMGAYSVEIIGDDHRNHTGRFADDMAAAAVVNPTTKGAGVLWPSDSDVFKVNVSAADAGKMIEVTLTAEQGAAAVDLLWWPSGGNAEEQEHSFWAPVPVAGDYGIVVRHNGEQSNLEINYSISVRFEKEYNYTGNFELDMGRATQIVVPGEKSGNELWPGDSDLFKINVPDALVGKMVEVTLTVPEGMDGNVAITWWTKDAEVPVNKENKFWVLVPEQGDYGIVVSYTGDSTNTIAYSIAVRDDKNHNLTNVFEVDMLKATPIGLTDSSGNQELWPADSDVYKLTVINEPDLNRELTVKVTAADDAPIRIDWWASGNNPVARGKEFTVTLTQTGEYGIIVRRTDGTSDTIVNYTLETTLAPAAAEGEGEGEGV